LLKIGIELCQATVAKYMVRRRKPPSQTWRTFLRNHTKDLVSLDFFVVPTITFQLLFTFVILSHDGRRLVHFAVTANPTAEWIARQLLQAFPWDPTPRYLLPDRDRAYGLEFSEMAKCMGIHELLFRLLRTIQDAVISGQGRANQSTDSTASNGSWKFLKLAACITSTRAKLPDRSGLPNASVRMQNKPYAHLPCEVGDKRRKPGNCG
jgi:hypothetical protein